MHAPKTPRAGNSAFPIPRPGLLSQKQPQGQGGKARPRGNGRLWSMEDEGRVNSNLPGSLKYNQPYVHKQFNQWKEVYMSMNILQVICTEQPQKAKDSASTRVINAAERGIPMGLQETGGARNEKPILSAESQSWISQNWLTWTIYPLSNPSQS